MAAETENQPRTIMFGGFVVDRERRTLRRGDELLVLPPRVLDTLLFLLDNAGEVLSKSEIIDAVWAETFVEEGNLTQNVYLLRRKLGKAPDGREWIETVPRRGYSFTGEVTFGESTAVTTVDSERAKVSKRRTWVIAVAAAIVLGVTAVLGWLYLRDRSQIVDMRRDVQLQKLTFTGDIEFAALSPDGRTVAFTRQGRLFTRRTDDENEHELPLPQGMQAGFVQFTPDGARIAFRDKTRFFLEGAVVSTDLAGKEMTKLAEGVWSGFGFSKDGRRIAFIRDLPAQNKHQLISKDLTDGVERVVSELDNPSRFILVSGPAYSPDGRRLAVAFSKSEPQAPRAQLGVFEIDNGEAKTFAPQELRQFEQAAWDSEGKTIYVVARENRKFFQLWSLSYPTGDLGRVTNDLSIYRQLSISTDAKRLLSTNFTTYSHIWMADATDLGAQRQATSGNLNRDGTVGLSWLADGSVIYSSRIFGNVDIFSSGATEADRRQLTHEAGEVNSYPVSDPAGQFVYFASTRTGNSQIWRMRPDGSEQTQVTFGEKETNEFPQISPDGNFLYFVRKGRNATAIWRRTLADSHEETLAVEGGLTPDSFLTLSPDGKLLATCELASQTSGEEPSQEYVIAIVTTERAERPKKIRLPQNWAVFAPDSSAIDFIDNKDGNAAAYRIRLDDLSRTLLFEAKGSYIAGLAWSPDGRSLAISRGKRETDAVLITNF